MAHNLETGDIVMCTVEKIAGAVVLVNIDGNGTGSIILSEVAPGRIRNIRNYVVPKKRIICKVLRINGNHIDLSLRRVTPKEQKEIREKYKSEKSYKSILKTVLKEKTEKLTAEILKNSTIYEFLEEAKTNSKQLEKLTGKENCKKILEILNSQRKREIEIKKDFSLSTQKENGITLIKKILKEIKKAKIKYISAGKYSIKVSSEDAKKADQKINEILKNIEDDSKKQSLNFSIIEK